jgi:quercetin dioxygenase-like cupin family protein
MPRSRKRTAALLREAPWFDFRFAGQFRGVRFGSIVSLWKAKPSSCTTLHRIPPMPLSLLNFFNEQAEAITAFSSQGASAVALAHGSGLSHAYAVHMAAGGEIGPHPAGFDQLFLVVQGSGWVAGQDGLRQSLGTFQGVFIPRGEVHSKGSASGLVAVMLQAEQFTGHEDRQHRQASGTDA